MKPNIDDSTALAGRILLSLIFLISGFGKITGFDATVAFIASKGLPLPQAGACLAIVVELGAGVMLTIGFKARWAALALAILTFAAAVLFHDFWNSDAASRPFETIHFLKNVSIIGGLLMVFAFGPGRYSIDRTIPAPRSRAG